MGGGAGRLTVQPYRLVFEKGDDQKDPSEERKGRPASNLEAPAGTATGQRPKAEAAAGTGGEAPKCRHGWPKKGE